MQAPETYSKFRHQVAQWIVNAEARRDKQGRLKVYLLKPADGGGEFEVAGVNDGYHPDEAEALRSLIVSGRHEEAERRAVLYIAAYTDPVMLWVKHRAIDAFLRDCCWNRGPKGALRILQLAVGVADDGRCGPVTRDAVKRAERDPERLLHRLRYFRETYERRIAPPVGDRAQFWDGLVARWDAAEQFARKFL